MNKEGFITEEEVVSFLNFNGLGRLGNILAKSLMKITKLDYLNEAYKERAHLPAIEFIDSMFEYLGIEYVVCEKDLLRIPKSGPFVTISNHPLGGIDGMILIRMLLERRPDFKVVANFILERVDPLKPYILSVNPFETRQDVRSSLKGIKETLFHLNEGHPIGVFPAGEVSTKQQNGMIEDREWLQGAIKIIKKSQVPVLPIYFNAYNSRGFYQLSQLSESLRTALLPRQMTTQSKRKITVRIGNLVSKKQYADFSENELSTYLREKTYFLKHSLIEKHKSITSTFSEPIADPIDRELIKEELEECTNSGKLQFKYKNYSVFRAKKIDIPNILNSIGREREVIFREVGEGTNKSLDLDQYDEYYEHLFIYDMDAIKLVGAYRMGSGKDIYEEYGIQGFYLSELFDIDEKIHPFFKDSIELGRAFISKAYQRNPVSLFLLWKGIIRLALKSKVKNLIGGVSISNNFSELSKSIIIDFIQSYHFDNELAQHVKAKNPFRINLSDEVRDFVKKDVDTDIQRLDKLIDDIELQSGMKIPVLLKKYLKQNAFLFAFNIDPKFNNAVDGLMYLKLDEMPKETIKMAMEKFEDKLIENQ